MSILCRSCLVANSCQLTNYTTELLVPNNKEGAVELHSLDPESNSLPMNAMHYKTSTAQPHIPNYTGCHINTASTQQQHQWNNIVNKLVTTLHFKRIFYIQQNNKVAK